MPLPTSPSGTHARRALVAAALALALATGCRRPPPGVAVTRMDEANPDSVETVLFLVGDAGEALPGMSPVLSRLQQEVEAWSGGLATDSAVAILFLGDNVYPVGVHDPGYPTHADDTLRLRAQLDVVTGPNARAHNATAFFVSGNHDWGNMTGAAGLQRVRNQIEHIDAARAAEGIRVRFLPPAGEPGPAVVDLGDDVRVLFMDTHWWLQERSRASKDAVFPRVEAALEGAGERHVVMAMHHPFASGGAHGGPMPVWEGLGILWLLRQTGSLVQDLNSVVYRELLFGLKDVFARVRRPLIFAAGHDHSLQVLEDVAPDEPHWTLVSGAGSKTSDVAYAEGMLYGDDVSGFMRVSFMTDGRVLLHVLATPSDFAVCSPPHVTDPEACMRDGLEGFEIVYTLRLN